MFLKGNWNSILSFIYINKVLLDCLWLKMLAVATLMYLPWFQLLLNWTDVFPWNEQAKFEALLSVEEVTVHAARKVFVKVDNNHYHIFDNPQRILGLQSSPPMYEISNSISHF
jgi:hypothetical protein